MKFTKYITIRFFSILLQLIGMSAMMFGLYAMTGYNVGVAHAGFAGPEAIKAENERLGTNYTYFHQFVNFWDNYLTGDCSLDASFFDTGCNRTLGITWERIGSSFRFGYSDDTIDKSINQSFRNSITIFMISFVIYTVLGIFLGIVAGINKGKADQIIKLLTSAVIGIPNVLMLIYMYRALLSTPSQRLSILSLSTINIGENMNTNTIWVLIYPILAHALISLPFIFRYTHDSVKNELKHMYIRTARAKGLSEFKIVKNHLLPNMYSKLIFAVAISIPLGVSNLAFVEYIFHYSGIFHLIFNSVISYNFPVLHAGTLYIGFFSFVLMTISNIIGESLNKLPEK